MPIFVAGVFGRRERKSRTCAVDENVFRTVSPATQRVFHFFGSKSV